VKDLPALRLWRGHTVHQRSVPFEHRFKYGLALIDVDIDRLDQAHRQASAFSVDRSNLFSFDRKDHGVRKSEDLRPWAETQFQAAGIDLGGGVIRLVTFPRHAFYKFAPISLWLGHGPDGGLKGILYEVNNTFGETHVYAARTPDEGRHRHDTEKAFHVSPFFDVSGTYEFTLRWSENDLRLIVATRADGKQSHMATITAKAQPATSGAFLALAFSKPFSTLAVTLGIHWQALKLWIKGAKYHSKPKQSPVRTTIAKQENAAPEAAPRLERTA
jgi:hypothetical protein